MSLRSEVIRIMNEILSDSKKITELPVGTAPTGAELVEAVQAGVNVSLTVSQLGGGGGGGSVVSVTGEFIDNTDPTNPVVTGINAALALKESLYRPFDRKTTDYVLVLGDAAKGIEMNVAIANTVQVPLFATVPFPANTIIPVVRYGVGEITITKENPSITIRNTKGAYTDPGQDNPMFLKNIGPDEWYLWNGGPAASGGTVTSVGFTGGIISVGTPTTTPAFTVAGTSGGIPYFSSSSTWATSAALAANAIVVGGGAGVAPATVTTGTGVLTALAANVGAANAFVTSSGAWVAVGSYLGSKGVGTAPNWTSLEYVTPEMYGAVGDGVTDDATAINNAVASGKFVRFGNKSYKILSTINIPSYAKLDGSGRTSIILASTAINMFTINGVRAEISNLTFQGNNTVNQIGISAIGTGAVPVAPFVTGTKVHQCNFDLLYTGLYTLNSFNPTTYEGAYIVTGCEFTSCTNAGAELGLAGEYNLFTGNKFHSNNYGLYLIGGNQTISSNSLTFNTNAFRIIGGSNNGKHLIIGNTINHNTTFSVEATSVSNGFRFEGNQVYSSGQFYMSSCSDVQIVGNTFSQSAVSFSNLTCTNVSWISNHFMFATTVTVTGTQPQRFGNTWGVATPNVTFAEYTLSAPLVTITGVNTTSGTGPFQVKDSGGNNIFLSRADGRNSIGGNGSPSSLSPFSGTAFNKTGAGIGFECSGNAFVVFNTNQSGAGVAGAGLVINGTNAPTSGTTVFGGVRIDHTLNQTGTSSGDYTMFEDNTTLTAMLGALYGVRIRQATAKSGFGLGATNPGAKVHIGAGTATAGTAPLKYTSSGTGLTGLLTAAEAGAMEFTTYGLWVTTTAAAREKVWHGLIGAAAPATNTIGVILDYYGTSATRVLTTPNTWISITGDDGNVYKVPAYS